MHFLRILVGSGSRSHVLDGIDSIIAFKPAKDSGSNFLNLEAHLYQHQVYCNYGKTCHDKFVQS